MLGFGLHANNSAGNLFGVSNLFSGGVKGAWYDPSDISTLFQDSAGTIPVTADGDPVGKILDKSGNGNHLIQATTTARPIYKVDGASGKAYLWSDYDGNGTSDAWMSCASFDMTGTENIALFAGLMKITSTAFAVFCELSATSATNSGTFTLTAPITAATNMGFTSRGTTSIAATRSGVDNDTSCNVVCLGNTGATNPSNAEIRVNALGTVAVPTDQGVSNYGSYPFYLFKRAGTSAQFNGRMYQLILLGKATTDAEITSAREYIASKVI